MAPRALTLEEENALLRKKLAVSNNKLQAALAAGKSNAVKKLIPQPKGQAGKGGGYSLCTAMRLDKNKPRYNRLMRLTRYYANRYLKTGKTISKQDPATLERVMIFIRKEIKYFQRFHGCWPIRAFIKQYLVNNNDKFRRALRQEREAEARDPAEWDDDDDNASDAEAGGDCDAEDSGDEDVSVAFDNNDNEDLMDEPEPADYMELDNLAAEDCDTELPTLEEGLDDGDAVLVFATPVKQKQASKENVAPASNNEGILDLSSKNKGKQKATTTPSPENPDVVHVEKRKQFESVESPSPAKKRKPNPQAEHVLLLVKARRAGWPIDIDFDKLPARISSLHPQLQLLLTDRGVLAVSPIWLRFLERINYQFFAFCHSESTKPFEGLNLGCG
ncbi:hypothetical protein MVEN_02233400 [Mycena venus]|uniref:Uncharacterized protein n=1 Tax=Mycena venus TaxID=2733690 RepID=A0A8H6X750_9AGAR|nr:hypothetical protein MVEN_02233400 [Mycena venus]